MNKHRNIQPIMSQVILSLTLLFIVELSFSQPLEFNYEKERREFSNAIFYATDSNVNTCLPTKVDLDYSKKSISIQTYFCLTEEKYLTLDFEMIEFLETTYDDLELIMIRAQSVSGFEENKLRYFFIYKEKQYGIISFIRENAFHFYNMETQHLMNKNPDKYFMEFNRVEEHFNLIKKENKNKK